MAAQRIGLSFQGGALASFGRTFLYVLLTVCIIPAAWGAVSLVRWWTESLTFSDGSRLRFEGRAGQMWGLFSALIILEILPQIASGRAPENKVLAVSLAATVVLLPLVALVKLQVYRWIVANLRLEPDGTARLTASYGGYLGWLVILTASFFTVIGWAWVLTAMIRWLCGHVRGRGLSITFTGTGLGLLGYTILWLVCSLLIFPIPLVLRSVYRWFTGHLVLWREAAEAVEAMDAAVAV